MIIKLINLMRLSFFAATALSCLDARHVRETGSVHLSSEIRFRLCGEFSREVGEVG